MGLTIKLILYMPFVLVIVGIIVVIGLGGYFFTATAPTEPLATETPIARVEETATPTPTTTISPETSASPTTPEPVPTTPSTPTAPTPTPATISTTPTAPTIPPPSPVTPAVPATAFKNGTYTASAAYVAPGRANHTVNLTLTIANDVVTESNITYTGDTVETSTSYQKRFSNAYKAEVVGKSLEGISLARVGGASLTSGAFNKAVAEVKTKAQI